MNERQMFCVFSPYDKNNCEYADVKTETCILSSRDSYSVYCCHPDKGDKKFVGTARIIGQKCGIPDDCPKFSKHSKCRFKQLFKK